MAEIGTVVSNLAPSGKSVINMGVWVLIIFLTAAVVLGLLYYYLWKKRRWNIKVEIKLTRSDGMITNGEWGQGFYDSKKGVVMIKRPGKGTKAIAMKIFDVRRYMQGTDLLTVIQAGPDDYRPILNSSWSEHEVDYEDIDKPLTDDKGNPLMDEAGNPCYEIVTIKESILNIKTDSGKNKAWRASFEEAAKNAYTISSIFRQFQTPIAVGIVVVCCFVGFAVLWTKLSGICN